MDDDVRVVDAPSTRAGSGASIHAPVAGAPEPHAASVDPAEPDAVAAAGRRPRRWLRRIAVALVVLIAGAAIGFQVQVSRVQDQVAIAETDQRIAELDEETARIQLASVGDRVDLAQANKADAENVLAGVRTAMTAQGLEEASLHDAQVKKANEVKDLRSQVKAVRSAIAAQKHLQPAANDCLFDLLRGLGDRSAKNTAACATVASSG